MLKDTQKANLTPNRRRQYEDHLVDARSEFVVTMDEAGLMSKSAKGLGRSAKPRVRRRLRNMSALREKVFLQDYGGGHNYRQ